MTQILNSIAANIWILIPLSAIVLGIFAGIVDSFNKNGKLKEENEMLRQLLQSKERQLNGMIQNQDRFDRLERRLLESNESSHLS